MEEQEYIFEIHFVVYPDDSAPEWWPTCTHYTYAVIATSLEEAIEKIKILYHDSSKVEIRTADLRYIHFIK